MPTAARSSSSRITRSSSKRSDDAHSVQANLREGEIDYAEHQAVLTPSTAETRSCPKSSEKCGVSSSDADDLRKRLPLGSRVTVVLSKQIVRGTVRYVGTTTFSDGCWIGLVLDEPRGKNDGAVHGERYFECSPSHGLFVRPKMIRTVLHDQPRGSIEQLGQVFSLEEQAESLKTEFRELSKSEADVCSRLLAAQEANQCTARERSELQIEYAHASEEASEESRNAAQLLKELEESRERELQSFHSPQSDEASALAFRQELGVAERARADLVAAMEDRDAARQEAAALKAEHHEMAAQLGSMASHAGAPRTDRSSLAQDDAEPIPIADPHRWTNLKDGSSGDVDYQNGADARAQPASDEFAPPQTQIDMYKRQADVAHSELIAAQAEIERLSWQVQFDEESASAAACRGDEQMESLRSALGEKATEIYSYAEALRIVKQENVQMLENETARWQMVQDNESQLAAQVACIEELRQGVQVSESRENAQQDLTKAMKEMFVEKMWKAYGPLATVGEVFQSWGFYVRLEQSQRAESAKQDAVLQEEVSEARESTQQNVTKVMRDKLVEKMWKAYGPLATAGESFQSWGLFVRLENSQRAESAKQVAVFQEEMSAQEAAMRSNAEAVDAKAEEGIARLRKALAAAEADAEEQSTAKEKQKKQKKEIVLLQEELRHEKKKRAKLDDEIAQLKLELQSKEQMAKMQLDFLGKAAVLQETKSKDLRAKAAEKLWKTCGPHAILVDVFQIWVHFVYKQKQEHQHGDVGDECVQLRSELHVAKRDAEVAIQQSEAWQKALIHEESKMNMLRSERDANTSEVQARILLSDIAPAQDFQKENKCSTSNVSANFVIEHVDLHKLSSEQKTGIIDACVARLGEAANVELSLVHVSLSSGSIKVDATIRLSVAGDAAGRCTTAEEVKAALQGTRGSIAMQMLVSDVSALPGIFTAVEPGQTLSCTHMAVDTVVEDPAVNHSEASVEASPRVGDNPKRAGPCLKSAKDGRQPKPKRHNSVRFSDILQEILHIRAIPCRNESEDSNALDDGQNDDRDFNSDEDICCAISGVDRER